MCGEWRPGSTGAFPQLTAWAPFPSPGPIPTSLATFPEAQIRAPAPGLPSTGWWAPILSSAKAHVCVTWGSLGPSTSPGFRAAPKGPCRAGAQTPISFQVVGHSEAQTVGKAGKGNLRILPHPLLATTAAPLLMGRQVVKKGPTLVSQAWAKSSQGRQDMSGGPRVPQTAPVFQGTSVGQLGYRTLHLPSTDWAKIGHPAWRGQKPQGRGRWYPKSHPFSTVPPMPLT